ncbi:MAG: asparagine synthase [Chlorobium sp.]|nr:asparagine synthase [Chlorobium sp.]
MFVDQVTGLSFLYSRDIARNKDIDEESLAYFLCFGYLPGNKTLFKDVTYEPHGASKACTAESICSYLKSTLHYDEETLLKLGVSAWEGAVAGTLMSNPGAIVVPISGGLDSRAVLGELLKHFSAKSIATYTFGTPGTWDYEIGNSVAKQAGTNHVSYDLQEYSFTQERLENRALLSNGATDLFTLAPLDYIARDFSTEGTVIWSGFMGDPSVGSHIPDPDLLAKWEDNYCLNKERYAKNVELEKYLASGSNLELFVSLPKVPDNSVLFAEELWDFQNRQMRYVIPQVLPEGHSYALPFLDKSWLQFALNLPLNWRKGQKFYKQMLCEAYPGLFSLPVKNNMGLPLGAPSWIVAMSRTLNVASSPVSKLFRGKTLNKNINYIDFESAIRDRPDVKSVVENNIIDLKKRGLIKKDFIEKLWRQHQCKSENCSRALTLLASLELLLKVTND